MKAVLFSINKPHTDNIKARLKRIELRLKPPKIIGPYKGYIYETKKHGGCGKVIGEFTAYNENTYRVCMGVPAHLVIESCVPTYDILKYTDNGKKDVTAISITDLVIYDKPKELSEFCSTAYKKTCGYCVYVCAYYPHCALKEKRKPISRPPQSWCYVEEWSDENDNQH